MNQEIIESVKITAEDQQKVLTALSSIQETLQPYMIALSTEQRRQLPKMSDKTAPFVEKCVAYTHSNPQFIPTYLDVAKMTSDLEAVESMTRMLRRVEQICGALNDSILLTGSDAYTAGLAYYNSVKQASRMNVPAAKNIYEDLRKRFPAKRKRDKENRSQ